ncbi:WG repeat-containing protein, partial [Bacteroidota bacterium]
KKIYSLLILAFVYFDISAQSDDLLLPAKSFGEWGYINKDNQWIIPSKYDDAFPFSEGLAAVNYFGKWGYINSQGVWVVEPRFSEAKSFSEGTACVKAYGKWGFIDKSGEWIIEARYHSVSMFSGGLAVVYYDEGYRYIDKTGRYVFDQSYEKALPFSEGLAFVKKDGHSGYIDFSGNWMIKCDFDEAYSFSDGLALVSEKRRYGYINHRGDQVIPLQYNDGFRFNQGIAPVKKGKQWGYIDKRGDWQIQPKFEYAASFNEGFAVVMSDDEYGLINRDGSWTIDPEYEELAEIGRTSSLEDEVEKLVMRRIYQWQLKGEFEKSQEYVLRVSDENRETAIDKIMLDCIQEVASHHVNLDLAELGNYNADGEFFMLNIPGVYLSMLPVPIEEALVFRDNWERVSLLAPVFSIADNQFLLMEINAQLDDKSYTYNANVHGMVKGRWFTEPEFGPVLIDLPDITDLELHNQPVVKVQGPADVDQDIPENNLVQNNVFALVIGNEDYSSYQVGSDGEINVEYAEADARTFAAYLNKTFGLPRENITLLVNATVGQMNQAIGRMVSLAKAYEGEAELIFYYAGHGLPDEETKEPYLIPVDVSGSDLTYAVKLEDVYNQLSVYETRRVTVFLDACFSGGARNQGLVAARGVRIRPKSPFVLGNLIVFSATAGNQTAFGYNEKGHGMFTYYLLKKFQETRGEVSYGILAHHLMGEVNRKSLLINNSEQTPIVKVSPIFQNTWQDFSFLNSTVVSNNQ